MAEDFFINKASIAIDCTAIFFLGGLIYYTTAFRRRGRLSDRLYFLILVTDIVAAIFDIMVDFFEFRPVRFQATFMMLGSTVFSGAVICLGFLFMLYVLTFTDYGEVHIVARWKYWFIPAVIAMVVLIINIFTGWVTYVDPKDHQYYHGAFYYVAFVPLVVYLIVIIKCLWKFNRPAMFVLIALIVGRLIMEALFMSVSSTAFFVAVILTYLHVDVMNDEFNTEVSK